MRTWRRWGGICARRRGRRWSLGKNLWDGPCANEMLTPRSRHPDFYRSVWVEDGKSLGPEWRMALLAIGREWERKAGAWRLGDGRLVILEPQFAGGVDPGQNAMANALRLDQDWFP